jgi:hypothetical protein
MVHDQFNLTLPPNISVESLPKEADVPFASNGDYIAKFGVQDNTLAYGRLLRVANFVYKPTEYSALRDFYQKISADDQAQVALKISPVAATVATTTPAGGK